MYRKVPQGIENRGYALGKIWRGPEILRAAGFSHTDMDFSGTGMTSCQVGMPDSGRARPRMGSCKARRRSRLLILCGLAK